MSTRRIHESLLLACALALPACNQDIDAGGERVEEQQVDDPLAVEPEVAANSLDEIYQTVLVRSCAAQPGLCHSGQFEPNLSTPALAYHNLVRRPSLERSKQLRVDPGNPQSSLLMAKLRNQEVISQMPLGAAPLTEEEIGMIEKWISDGALRRPGAEPPPTLNNPPGEPQFGVFDTAGTRLDVAGPINVAAQQSLVFRFGVEDFETDDATIPFVALLLQTAEGMNVMLGGGDEKNLGIAVYDDAGAPEGKGDVLNWRFDYTMPETLTLIGETGTMDVPAAGQSLTVVPLYIDQAIESGGMLGFALAPNYIKVQP
jgi:hypothetical protein